MGYRIPFSIRYIIALFALLVLMFITFRLVLLYVEFEQLKDVEHKVVWLVQSFLMGFRFDALITAFLLTPLLLFFALAHSLNVNIERVLKVGMIYCAIIFLPVFFICAADIPFYKQFGERFSSTAFEWSESKGFTLKLIFGAFSYWGYLFLFLGLYTIYFLMLRRIKSKFAKWPVSHANKGVSKNYFLNGVSYLFISSLFVLCMRGRLSSKSPIQEGTAFISEYMFINELGLNPVYTLYSSLNSSKYSSISFMKDDEAIKDVMQYLDIKQSDSGSPFSRNVVPDSSPRKMNVVIVIMESMCTFKMGDYGGPNLTPQLDSLIHNSLYFSNIYSAGIHTFNGIYSTLYGFPGILRWQPLLDIKSEKYNGLPSILKVAGYRNIYFTTHDEQFDNVGGFLRYNGFDRIVSQADYPSSEVISATGVPDHFMFKFSLPILDSLSTKGGPFLSIFMTGSNHGPWIIPTNIPFKPDAKNEEDRATQYADWAIGNFLKNASSHPWFKNTIFVFLGDHGISMGHTYDLSLSYHHIPLIFYSPILFSKGEIKDNFGGQIDVFPTLLHLLNLPYINTIMGVDLFSEIRPSIYFTDDDKVGCIGPNYYFIHRMAGNESLYRYDSLSKVNYLGSEPAIASRLRTYVFSHLQATQWLISKGKFGLPKSAN